MWRLFYMSLDACGSRLCWEAFGVFVLLITWMMRIAFAGAREALVGGRWCVIPFSFFAD